MPMAKSPSTSAQAVPHGNTASTRTPSSSSSSTTRPSASNRPPSSTASVGCCSTLDELLLLRQRRHSSGTTPGGGFYQSGSAHHTAHPRFLAAAYGHEAPRELVVYDSASRDFTLVTPTLLCDTSTTVASASSSLSPREVPPLSRAEKLEWVVTARIHLSPAPPAAIKPCELLVNSNGAYLLLVGRRTALLVEMDTQLWRRRRSLHNLSSNATLANSPQPQQQHPPSDLYCNCLIVDLSLALGKHPPSIVKARWMGRGNLFGLLYSDNVLRIHRAAVLNNGGGSSDGGFGFVELDAAEWVEGPLAVIDFNPALLSHEDNSWDSGDGAEEDGFLMVDAAAELGMSKKIVSFDFDPASTSKVVGKDATKARDYLVVALDSDGELYTAIFDTKQASRAVRQNIIPLPAEIHSVGDSGKLLDRFAYFASDVLLLRVGCGDGCRLPVAVVASRDGLLMHLVMCLENDDDAEDGGRQSGRKEKSASAAHSRPAEFYLYDVLELDSSPVSNPPNVSSLGAPTLQSKTNNSIGQQQQQVKLTRDDGADPYGEGTSSGNYLFHTDNAVYRVDLHPWVGELVAATGEQVDVPLSPSLVSPLFTRVGPTVGGAGGGASLDAASAVVINSVSVLGLPAGEPITTTSTTLPNFLNQTPKMGQSTSSVGGEGGAARPPRPQRFLLLNQVLVALTNRGNFHTTKLVHAVEQEPVGAGSGSSSDVAVTTTSTPVARHSGHVQGATSVSASIGQLSAFLRASSIQPPHVQFAAPETGENNNAAGGSSQLQLEPLFRAASQHVMANFANLAKARDPLIEAGLSCAFALIGELSAVREARADCAERLTTVFRSLTTAKSLAARERDRLELLERRVCRLARVVEQGPTASASGNGCSAEQRKKQADIAEKLQRMRKGLKKVRGELETLRQRVEDYASRRSGAFEQQSPSAAAQMYMLTKNDSGIAQLRRCVEAMDKALK